MKGVFVTGTDTNVGKTTVSAALMQRYRMSHELCYWKPVQTGAPPDNDTETVRGLGGCTDGEMFDNGIRLPVPVSPHLAARLAGTEISIEQVMKYLPANTAGKSWIVEGAGGVLVPLNRKQMMIDLIDALTLPVVIVGRAGLGTINHTLLTVSALRARSITVAGVVLTGEGIDDNADSIAEFGNVKILGRMPHLAAVTEGQIRHWAQRELDRDGVLAKAMEGRWD
ncbi:dethiobiotin synthase [Silvibacterium acidisoli]|uniref:dethiobiotin synthase n=1 Tax=Acidobacteriaceae bacterium ZG23-2 TaxID=2883246 RepID=UPI00406C104C